jgi:hypothetical protein
VTAAGSSRRARAARRSRTSCATGSSRGSATGASPFPSTSRSRLRRRPAQARREVHHPLRPAHRRRRVELPLRLPRPRGLPPRRRPRGPARARRRLALLPEGRQVVRARDEHDAAVGGVVLVLPALPRPAQRRSPGAKRRTTRGCPSISTSAARARRPAPSLRALLAQGALRPRHRERTPSRSSSSSTRG